MTMKGMPGLGDFNGHAQCPRSRTGATPGSEEKIVVLMRRLADKCERRNAGRTSLPGNWPGSSRCVQVAARVPGGRHTANSLDHAQRRSGRAHAHPSHAVDFCRERGIEFWGVNVNPDQAEWTSSTA